MEWRVIALNFLYAGLGVVLMFVSYRLIDILTPSVDFQAELKNGNMAVGVVLGGVVFVMALYVSDGISRLTKALIPQPSIGQVEFAR